MPLVHRLNCKTCGYSTIHAEDAVPDSKSATVWHCLICGTERRPDEHGTPNQPARPQNNPKQPQDSIKKIPVIMGG